MGKNERIMEYLEDGSQLVGTMHRELIDKNTGETIEVEQTLRFKYGSKHFWKCYMAGFLKIMDSLSGRQFKVFTYIIRHTRASDNMFICTYEKMVDELDCSKRTVSETLKILQDKHFIAKKQNGVWIINPDVLLKGNDRKRNMIASEYWAAAKAKRTKKKKSKKNSCEQKQREEESEENSCEQKQREEESEENSCEQKQCEEVSKENCSEPQK